MLKSASNECLLLFDFRKSCAMPLLPASSLTLVAVASASYERAQGIKLIQLSTDVAMQLYMKLYLSMQREVLAMCRLPGEQSLPQ